jgi:hypothetical protein
VDGSAHTDRECRALSTCTGTQWEERAHTKVADRVCSAHTTCRSDEWEHTPAGEKNDRGCYAHKICTQDEWQSKDGGKFNDRDCVPIVECTEGQWETVSPSKIRNRECKAFTICDDKQWETKAAGTHHDRTCENHVECTVVQWEFLAPGTHHNRICNSHRVCGNDEYQTKAATTTSDRTCADSRTLESEKATSIGSGLSGMLRLQGKTAGVEAVLATQADGSLSISASKCVVRSNFCGIHASDDCPMPTAAAASAVKFSVSGNLLQLYEDGTLYFKLTSGCVSLNNNPAVTGSGGGILRLFNGDTQTTITAGTTISAAHVVVHNRDPSIGSFKLAN